jgi:hypothetical protein
MSSCERRRVLAVACIAACGLTGPGCRLAMHDQPRYEDYEASPFFPDSTSARPLPAGTVARGSLPESALYATGMNRDSTLATSLPMALSRELLDRGRERYEIYCTPCHDRVGSGRGMVVQRGYTQPPSMHIDRLRAAPVGHFFDVITRGFGRMPSYAVQVRPADRWAITAYIRALQLSQHLELARLPPAERQRLEAALRAAPSRPSRSGEAR